MATPVPDDPLVPVIASLLFLTACPGPIVDPPPPYENVYSYLGTWTGTLDDSVGGAGNVTFEIISQSNTYSDTLNGSWTADFGNETRSGILRSDYVYANTLSANLISSATPDCIYNASMTRTESTLRGTYLSFGCTPYVTGTLELTKQP